MIINDIQFNVSLEEIFEELRSQLAINGIQYFEKGYRNSGDHIMVQCPFHGNGQERKPSMGMRKCDGIGHCFACNKTYSLPEVISYCFGYNDMLGKEGIKWLIKNFATIQVEERKDVEIDLERNNFSYKTRTSSDRHAIVSDSDVDNMVSEEELDSYRYYHPYWKKRGITDDRIIELFDLGYDYKTKSIVFPVRDAAGRCLFVARRSVAVKWFNYPEGATKPLYGLYELEYTRKHDDNSIRKDTEIFICESMIDCLLLWQSGYYAVALNGLGNDLQFKQLMALPVRKFILATDNDEAGQKARERIKRYVKGKMFTEIEFPKGIKDIGECTQEQIDNILDWEVL